MLVDETKGCQFMSEIKEHLVSSFQWVTQEGAMCQEGMRGIKFSIVDTKLIADSIHRGGGQLIPAARRVYYASQLTAKPRLVEPIFLCEIQTPDSALGGVYSCMAARRGNVFSEERIGGTPMITLKCYLPVADSFGFT